MNINKMISELNKYFPEIEATNGEEWNGSTSNTSIWFKNIEGAEIDGDSIFNPYSYHSDPKENIWIMGTHKKLAKFLEKNKWHSEPYDNGTLMAYKD